MCLVTSMSLLVLSLSLYVLLSLLATASSVRFDSVNIDHPHTRHKTSLFHRLFVNQYSKCVERTNDNQRISSRITLWLLQTKLQSEQKKVAQSYGASCCSSLKVTELSVLCWVKMFFFPISSAWVLNYHLHETAVILLIILSESLKHSINSTRSTAGRSKEPFNTTS